MRKTDEALSVVFFVLIRTMLCMIELEYCLESYDYHLPPEAIAQRPHAPSDESKLLHIVEVPKGFTGKYASESSSVESISCSREPNTKQYTEEGS